MDQVTHNKIVSFLWGIADDVLRDLFKRGKYPDVILPMCVIRRIDAVLEPTKQAVLETRRLLDEARITEQRAALCEAAGQAFYNTSKFTLRDLKSRGSQQQLLADFEDYLNGFSPNVQDILDNFKFRNQLPTLSKADAIGALISKFLDPDIDLSPTGIDNHSMGTVFEELVRKFNEDNNEEAGEHWTPRDAVRLMANLVFLPIEDKVKSGHYLLYDCACGTGGMLTVGEETLTAIGTKRGQQVKCLLYGQEINPETYAVCKADMLLKGEGESADHIIGGAEWSTLSHDAFPADEFDFMLSNPPYGKSWKKDMEAMGGKDGMRDPRFKVMHQGEELSLVTRSSDGQMLFLANMASKMNSKSALGSRIAEVHNGSSLFTGDAGQGESNIRRWLIENDWLEAIVALPLNLFYNTGIATYIWVLSNRKPAHRKGRVQLIDASQWFKPLRKNLGMKNCELAPEDIDRISRTFLDFSETPESKIFPNAAFGYWKVTVERPLRLHSQFSLKAIETLRFTSGDEDIRTALYEEFGDDLFTNFAKVSDAVEARLADWGNGDEERDEEEGSSNKGLPEKKKKKLLDPKTWERDGRLVETATKLREALGDKLFEDHNIFRDRVDEALDELSLKLSGADLKLILRAVSWRAETAPPVIAKVHRPGKATVDPLHGRYTSPVGDKKLVLEYEPDPDLRDTEQVPLLEDGGIEAFIRREVLPYTSDAWVKEDATRIGYEISFTRHFYKPQPLRTLEEIRADILAIEKDAEGLLDDVVGGGGKVSESTGEVVLYRTDDGRTRVQVRLVQDSAWLSLNQIAELFDRDKSVISKHIRNIFDEGEIDPARTVAKFATVQTEGTRSVTREIEFYRLEVILAVGYRVHSPRGTQFRQWATAQLREYLVKGFAMDDERLKQAGGGDYFDELLARIRDIRSSERVFWRKVLDIYSTSVDYDPAAEASQKFFAVVQNKMHWAAHGHTAAEVIARRADSTKPNMGMTTWTGSRPRRADAGVAKNYLAAEEIETLNLIVSAYLDFAELQARNRRPMAMRDWITKLDDFLRLSDRELLSHAGAISHKAALAKAEAEYDKFRTIEDAKPQPVDVHLEEAIEQAKQIGATKGKQKAKPGRKRGDGMIADLKLYPEYRESGLPWLGPIPAHWEVQRNGRLFSQRNETGFADLPILEVSLKTGVRVRDFGDGKRKQIMADHARYKRAARADIAYNMMRLWQGAVGVAPVDGLVSPAYVVARPHSGIDSRYCAYLFRTDAYMREVNKYSHGIVSDRNRLYWDEFKQMPSVLPPHEEQRAITRYLDHRTLVIRRLIQNRRNLITLLNEQKQAIIHRAVTRGLDPTVPLKPSGVLWLGDIPHHWEVRRLRTLVHGIDQGVSPLTVGFLAEGDSWGVLKSGCVNRGIFRETEHKQLARGFEIDPAIVVKIGDVLISRACGSPTLVGSVGRVKSLRYQLILSDKTFRACFGACVDADFMVFAMNCRYYRHQVEQAISGAEGMANNLPLSSLRDFHFAIPPKDEAAVIAAFLERETVGLQTTVSRLEREIELLREYRTTLVSDVVTGKLDVREAAAHLPEEAAPDATECDTDLSTDPEAIEEEAAV